VYIFVDNARTIAQSIGIGTDKRWIRASFQPNRNGKWVSYSWYRNHVFHLSFGPFYFSYWYRDLGIGGPIRNWQFPGRTQ
jgi:hypothetical protein